MPFKRFTNNLVIREPFLIVVLLLFTVIFFFLTRTYTSSYERRCAVLGRQWFDRANNDIKKDRPAEAVQGFETALVYAPKNREYLTHLAAALVASGRTSEALSYYQNLWQENPRDGAVNLQLARITASQGDVSGAGGYFNGAIFGNWPDDGSTRRRDAAFEWVHYLLERNDKNRAQSQLLSLAETLPPDPGMHRRLGDDFRQTGAPVYALEQYRLALKYDPDYLPALLAAGQTAFQLGKYNEGESYVNRYLRGGSSELGTEDLQKAHSLLAVIRAAHSLSPFSANLSDEERIRRVIRNFQIAGQRLQSCVPPVIPGAPQTSTNDEISQSLTKWRQMEPSITFSNLHKNPSIIDDTMNYVLTVEQQTVSCGIPSAEDMALLSIAHLQANENK
jgi:tetratricopeptide (TPR) repeat protein